MEEEFLAEFADRAVAGRCRVAIDIGANTGEWTRWLANQFDHVLAIEPDPRAYGELLNGLPGNVHHMMVAAGEKHAVADFHLRPDTRQSSLLAEHPIGGAGQEDAPVAQTVSVTTLSLDVLRDVCRQYFGTDEIDFVKIDVEGAEAAVLSGASPEHFAGTRFLVEIHDTREAVGAQLRRLGRDEVRVIRHPAENAHPQHFWMFAPSIVAEAVEPESDESADSDE
jgi:FkbM family methyltransferase